MNLLNRIFYSLLAIALTVTGHSAFAMSNGEIVIESDPTGMAMVGVIIQGDGALEYCTGTLVGPKTVLTAGHCFYGLSGYKATVVFGTKPFQYAVNASAESKKLGLKSEAEFLKTFAKYKKSSSVLLHPDYKDDLIDSSNDLALVYLEEAVTNVKPIPFLPMQRPLALTDSLTVYGSGLNVFAKESASVEMLLETSFKKAKFGILKETEKAISEVGGASIASEVQKVVGQTGLGQKLILIAEVNSEKLNVGDSGSSALVFKGIQPYIVGIYSKAFWKSSTQEIFAGMFVNVQESAKAKWLSENIK